MKQLIRVTISDEKYHSNDFYQTLHFELISKNKRTVLCSIEWQRNPISNQEHLIDWYGIGMSAEKKISIREAVVVGKFLSQIATRIQDCESPSDVWKCLNGEYAEYNSKLSRYVAVEESSLWIYRFERGDGELYASKACKHDKHAYKINQEEFHGLMFYKNTSEHVGWHSPIYDTSKFIENNFE